MNNFKAIKNLLMYITDKFILALIWS